MTTSISGRAPAAGGSEAAGGRVSASTTATSPPASASSASASLRRSATTAPARQPRPAATARSYPGSRLDAGDDELGPRGLERPGGRRQALAPVERLLERLAAGSRMS